MGDLPGPLDAYVISTLGAVELQQLTRGQLRAFLAHVESDRQYAAWLLAATIGMRRGELLVGLPVEQRAAAPVTVAALGAPGEPVGRQGSGPAYEDSSEGGEARNARSDGQRRRAGIEPA